MSSIQLLRKKSIYLLKTTYSGQTTMPKSIYEKIKDEHELIPIIERNQDNNYERTIYMYEKDVRAEQKEAEEYGFARNSERYPVFSEADVVAIVVID